MIELEKREENAESKRLPFFIRLFLPLAPTLRKLAKSELFDNFRKKTAEMLEMSGFDEAVSSEDFVAVRIIMGTLGFLCFFLMIFGGQLLMGVLVLFLFVVYPPTWLKGVIRRRQLSILKALPNMLDLLTLSVEAGKNFLTALRDILEKRPETVYLRKTYDKGNFVDFVAGGNGYEYKEMVLATEQDLEIIKKGVQAQLENLKKRCAAYWKRFGGSKLKTWTYWADA
jgi:hypothetical protein